MNHPIAPARAWSPAQLAFARHRYEWLTLGNIPADDFGLDTNDWWAVIEAYNAGDMFDGTVPGDGKPRFVSGWEREQIDRRMEELAALALALPARATADRQQSPREARKSQ